MPAHANECNINGRSSIAINGQSEAFAAAATINLLFRLGGNLAIPI